MQLLAYGLMFDAEHISNIFPTQDGTNNVYYKCNKINSNENKDRFYHQLEIAIDNSWTFAMDSKTGDQPTGLLEYLNGLLNG
jgi:hypothetical protein